MAPATNRLIHEKSPYLLQHARNPVNWFPWGEEAFAKARSEDRLIFLSIGYATCHWCHVMEHESFENEATAHIMNDRFVSIKVDREELPDVDSIYMTALGAMGQTGGWPLNMFLTPDLCPIAGGTYFPPEPRWGRPSFTDVLIGISDVWQMDRSRILNTAMELKNFLKERSETHHSGNMPAKDLPWLLPGILEQSFDEEYGGFLTAGPNKFPPFLPLMLLLRLYRRNGEEPLLQMIEKTLGGMRRGGIYDQIGGGLCRYSTDHQWLVPHFEKMLYDNALFVQTIVEAFRVTQRVEYRKWALEVLNYVERDMTTQEGAFCTAEDADSEGEEGRFYLWPYAEFHSVLQHAGLSPSEVELLRKFWGVTTNGNFEGSNILHEKVEREAFAKEDGNPVNDLEDLINRGARALLESREARVRPLRDDKILLSWNALMISAIARASLAFGRQDLVSRAEKAATFLFNNLRVHGDWKRRYRDGEARFEATLSDHALLGLALLDLFRATGVVRYYSEANNLAEIILGRFIENNRIYETSPETPHLLLRPVDCYDGVIPSGPSAALQLFVSLQRYGSSASEFYEAASSILQQFHSEMERAPQGCTAMLSGWLTLTDEPVEIALTGRASVQRQATIDWIGAKMEAETIFAWSKETYAGKNRQKGEETTVPLLTGKNNERQAIYLCRNLACAEPFDSIKQLERALANT